MKIALDLDGVLANLQSINLQRWSIDTGRMIYHDDVDTWDASHRITGYDDYYTRYYLNVWRDHGAHIVPLERDVSVTSRLLSCCGTVDIVTSHNEEDRSVIKKWLEDHNVYHDKLILHGFYNSKENIQYDVIIDDNPALPQKLLNANNFVKLFLYDQPYNQNVLACNQNVLGSYIRVKTLRDVYSYLLPFCKL